MSRDLSNGRLIALTLNKDLKKIMPLGLPISESDLCQYTFYPLVVCVQRIRDRIETLSPKSVNDMKEQIIIFFCVEFR